MTQFKRIPSPKFDWMRHRTQRKPKQAIPLGQILDDIQFNLYQNATKKQRRWLEEFARTGDSDLAARIAYPTAKPASVYRLSMLARRKFKISKKEIEQFIQDHPQF